MNEMMNLREQVFKLVSDASNRAAIETALQKAESYASQMRPRTYFPHLGPSWRLGYMSPFTRNVANLRSQDRPVTRYHDAINALFKKIDTLGYSTTALRAMKFFSIAGAVAFGATLLTFGTKFFTSAEKSDA